MPRNSTHTHCTPEQKARIVLELLREEQTIEQIANVHRIQVSTLSEWKAQAMERLPSLFSNENQVLRGIETARESKSSRSHVENTQLQSTHKPSGIDFIAAYTVLIKAYARIHASDANETSNRHTAEQHPET